jgi:hypothetical protein
MTLNKPWEVYDSTAKRRIPGTLGVYELGNAAGDVVYIGFAGGKSRMGLRGEISARLQERPADEPPDAAACQYRYEVNMMYLTRYIELLERHQDAAGQLPPDNMRAGEYIPGPVLRRGRRLRASEEGE